MSYTFDTHNTDNAIDAIGTCFTGYITVPRSKLVSIFGQPIVDAYEDKICCEWIIKATDEYGVSDIITIYDWKNYDKSAMADDYNNWNVGGNNKLAPSILLEIIEAMQECEQVTKIKNVIVPQFDLDALESARLELVDIMKVEQKTNVVKYCNLMNISQKMWQLTHRKYPESS